MHVRETFSQVGGNATLVSMLAETRHSTCCPPRDAAIRGPNARGPFLGINGYAQNVRDGRIALKKLGPPNSAAFGCFEKENIRLRRP